MNAPLDPSISDLLRGSSLAPMMDQPVSHILHSMGLPPLPDLPPVPPLPGLPPLPVIDLSAIVRPLTDLVSSFGTGQFGATAPNPVPANSAAATNTSAAPGTPDTPAAADPTQTLQAITTGLQTAMQLGTSALQLVMQLWQGQGAQQAATTGTKAAASGTELVGQSTSEKAILGGGATSVFTGAGLMAGVMGKYTATAAATAPFLALPGGQVFLLEATAEAIAEGLAVVAKTRGEMTVHSANMTEAGTKVKVSSAPTGVAASSAGSSSIDLQQLMQLISPLGQLLSTAAQSVPQLAAGTKSLSTVDSARSGEVINTSAPPRDVESGSGQGGSGSGGGAFVGGGSLAAAPPLSPSAPSTSRQLTGSTAFGTGSATSPEATATEPAAASRPMSTSSPGAMPMSGAGGAGALGAAGGLARARASREGEDSVHDNLVTGSNGDEIVGPLQRISLPVVGALGHPNAIEVPPDKEWTF